MNQIKNFISNTIFIFSNIGRLSTLKNYERSNFNSPPAYVKQRFLAEQQPSVWIETGTYNGDTTKVLASVNPHVTTIEAQEVFYLRNISSFSKVNNIMALCGESDKLLKSAIEHYESQGILKINFFLDAHYSGGKTYGRSSRSPILQELEIIEKFLPKLNAVRVFIDDFRLFNNSIQENHLYPSRDYLVDFARKNCLFWDISHDMFIMFKVPELNQR